MQNSRNTGLDHGAGKGDADRSDRKKFQKGLARIKLTGQVEGFERRGNRLVKVYGLRARGERVILGGGLTAHDVAKIDADIGVAQSFADQQNALFRKNGFDTCGH